MAKDSPVPVPISPWPELRAILTQRGLSIADLARGSGIPYLTLSRLVNGYSRPSARVLGLVSRFLQVSPAELSPGARL